MTTEKIWDYLQNHDYFVYHRHYNNFQMMQPSYVEPKDIKDKVVLDFGNGFGRHLAWFSKYASKCFGVEINKKIQQEAFEFIKKHGDIKKTSLLLTSNYKKRLCPLDYVFCRFVFQHISKQQTKDFIGVINKHLKIYGKINFQFRLGTTIKIEKNKEPIVEWTLEEIDELLENFEIGQMYIHDNNQAYIIGTKLL